MPTFTVLTETYKKRRGRRKKKKKKKKKDLLVCADISCYIQFFAQVNTGLYQSVLDLYTCCRWVFDKWQIYAGLFRSIPLFQLLAPFKIANACVAYSEAVPKITEAVTYL